MNLPAAGCRSHRCLRRVETLRSRRMHTLYSIRSLERQITLASDYTIDLLVQAGLFRGEAQVGRRQSLAVIQV